MRGRIPPRRQTPDGVPDILSTMNTNNNPSIGKALAGEGAASCVSELSPSVARGEQKMMSIQHQITITMTAI